MEVIPKWEEDAESKVLEGHPFSLLAKLGKTKLIKTKNHPTKKQKKGTGVRTLIYPISHILHKDFRLAVPSLFLFLIVMSH